MEEEKKGNKMNIYMSNFFGSRPSSVIFLRQTI